MLGGFDYKLTRASVREFVKKLKPKAIFDIATILAQPSPKCNKDRRAMHNHLVIFLTFTSSILRYTAVTY